VAKPESRPIPISPRRYELQVTIGEETKEKLALTLTLSLSLTLTLALTLTLNPTPPVDPPPRPAKAPPVSTDNLLEVHPAREELYEELHSRPSPLVETPCSITHIAVQISPNERGAEHGHLAELCAQFGTNRPSESASCFYQTFEGFELRWERQTEFSTYTFIHRVMGDPCGSLPL